MGVSENDATRSVTPRGKGTARYTMENRGREIDGHGQARPGRLGARVLRAARQAWVGMIVGV
ncbi:hypothetical protein GCM10009097_44810 [Pigmentiphaga daeguensis]|uniref:Uncharacterized protein n=1 Tax=Pigmentiphaga daeguensis TaxID=414049 RepID=A0ABN1CN08_9BURK